MNLFNDLVLHLQTLLDLELLCHLTSVFFHEPDDEHDEIIQINAILNIIK